MASPKSLHSCNYNDSPDTSLFMQTHSLLILAKKWKWGQLISERAECEGSSMPLCIQMRRGAIKSWCWAELEQAALQCAPGLSQPSSYSGLCPSSAASCLGWRGPFPLLFSPSKPSKHVMSTCNPGKQKQNSTELWIWVELLRKLYKGSSWMVKGADKT